MFDINNCECPPSKAEKIQSERKRAIASTINSYRGHLIIEAARRAMTENPGIGEIAIMTPDSDSVGAFVFTDLEARKACLKEAMTCLVPEGPEAPETRDGAHFVSFRPLNEVAEEVFEVIACGKESRIECHKYPGGTVYCYDTSDLGLRLLESEEQAVQALRSEEL